MAIRELEDGRWRVQVDVGRTIRGKRDRRTKVCKTEREAKKAELAFLMEKERNGGVSGRITLERFIDEVFAPEKQAVVRKNTWRGYERDIRLRIKPKLGSMEVSAIKKLHVQRMVSSCPTYQVAKNARDTLRTVLAMAFELEMVPRNAAAGTFHYPDRPQDADEASHGEWVTSFAEHAALIEAARGDEVFPIVVLGLCFGLRGGEIFGMDWENVDFASREVRVRQTYTFTAGACDMTPPKTKGSVRDVPMTDYALGLMRELRDAGGVTRVKGPVVTWKGERMTPYHGRDAVTRFRESHDVPAITVMSLRHSFATAAVRSGMNVASVSKWLGHADVSTTLNRYVRPLMGDLHEDAKVVDAAYGGHAAAL